MKYIPFEDDYDPGMRYEGLARYVFDGQSYGGPNNVAHQSVYNSLFIPNVNDEGILVFNQILEALIIKDADIKQEFFDLKTSLKQRMK